MIREDAYVSRSQRELNAVGATSFDSYIPRTQNGVPTLVPDDVFRKGMEAINRDDTPSVPIHELGGRKLTPDDISRIALVDFDFLRKSEQGTLFDQGVDGAGFAMPGILPGAGGTVRLNTVMKGALWSLNYKSYINRMRGKADESLDPFYMVSPLAPTPVQDWLSDVDVVGSNSALRGLFDEKFKGQYRFDDYFSDVMQSDVVLPAAMVKAIGFKQSGTTLPEWRSNLSRLMFDKDNALVPGYELRMHATDESMLTKDQAFLSEQLTRILNVPTDEITRRAQGEAVRAAGLETSVQTIIGALFSGDDETSKAVRANNS